MTIRPARRDPERIRTALGIQPRPAASVDDALAALAALKRRYEVLGIESTKPRLTDAEGERALEALARGYRFAP
jgi:alkanesulfonate monooxygenase SsuD/methylene tetrahydromethanopterin reductase-like flavin-dependent oxidoreductase (luciferase family)